MGRNCKLILLTGSTGGIGSALCEHLANKGYDLILLARDATRLGSLTEDLAARFP
jgi:uncharacterized protein